MRENLMDSLVRSQVPAPSRTWWPCSRRRWPPCSRRRWLVMETIPMTSSFLLSRLMTMKARLTPKCSLMH